MGKKLKGQDKHQFTEIILGLNPAAFNVNTDEVQLKNFTKGFYKASLENLACSLCGSEYRIEMHHIRKMKDLNPKARYIDKIMARKNRKQISLCRKCHIEYKNSGSK
jgi:hypothetical protein